MRHVLRVLVAVTILLTVASPVSAGSVHTAAGESESQGLQTVDANPATGSLDEAYGAQAA